MSIPNLSWVRNLNEVGAPILDAAQKSALQLAQADADLAYAKENYRAQIRHYKQSVRHAEEAIAKLWTPEEIDAAKLGFVLVDGRKIEGVKAS